jgi:NADH-quinone oxidoreductase subunit L
MLALLWLVPALPLLGCLLLLLSPARTSERATSAIGVGSTGFAALIAILIGYSFVTAPPQGRIYEQVLWQWIGDFTPQVVLRLDALSLVMMLVITFVGFVIHLYSAEFMATDEGYARFFAYMNLFVAAMLVLVLANNLLVLYAGWEGVGLCSYLLIGFWYRNPDNGHAARKAFLITRIGDTALLVGLLLLFAQLHTLTIAPLLGRAIASWSVSSPAAVAAAALLLGGALGKSAQLPLQTWLPDAMAGPTPVSALIHAATMVTAGVYLIARMHPLFELAPAVQSAVAVIGASTLLLAAFSALNQRDLKRILAYSTMSQIGYMFLALGVGAWSAAIFHFMTHAFFKALLFLAAGAVMMCIRDEHNIFRMGGLRHSLPGAFWSFLIGAASLAAFPLVTAGFYSKDLILWGAWASGPRGPLLWLVGFVGAFLTALYSFRAVFVVFFGDMNIAPAGRRYGWRITIPLAALSTLAIVAGGLDTPRGFGHVTAFSDWLAPVLPTRSEISASATTQWLVMAATVIATLLGIYLAYVFYVRRRAFTESLIRRPFARALHGFLLGGWGFDWLYDHVFTRPFVWLAQIDRDDIVDAIYRGFALLGRVGYASLSRSENGRVRWYAGWLAVGSLAALAVTLLL